MYQLEDCSNCWTRNRPCNTCKELEVNKIVEDLIEPYRQRLRRRRLSREDITTNTELENELAEKIIVQSFKWFLVVVEILIVAYFILQII